LLEGEPLKSKLVHFISAPVAFNLPEPPEPVNFVLTVNSGKTAAVAFAADIANAEASTSITPNVVSGRVIICWAS
jgi:hypothetical protein